MKEPRGSGQKRFLAALDVIMSLVSMQETMASFLVMEGNTTPAFGELGKPGLQEEGRPARRDYWIIKELLACTL